MELEITWKRTLKIWMSYIGYCLLFMIVAMIVGGVVGFIFGFLLAALEASNETIQIVKNLLGIIIGLLISIVPIKMILGKDFGEFRLVLLKEEIMEDHSSLNDDNQVTTVN